MFPDCSDSSQSPAEQMPENQGGSQMGPQSFDHQFISSVLNPARTSQEGQPYKGLQNFLQGNWDAVELTRACPLLPLRLRVGASSISTAHPGGRRPGSQPRSALNSIIQCKTSTPCTSVGKHSCFHLTHTFSKVQNSNIR